MIRLRCNLRERWLSLYFGFSVLVVAFLSGVAVARFEIFPYPMLEGAWSAILDWRANWKSYLGIRPDQLIERARFEGSGVTTYLPDKVSEGVTLTTGLWDGKHGIRLLALDGTQLHAWNVSFNEIWPAAPQLEDQPRDWDSYVHGTLLYPDGGLVFNFDYKGLVKLDWCGNVIWRLPQETHHSIYEHDDGNLWVGHRRRVTEPRSDFAKLSVPFLEDSILEVSPDGRVLREISMIDTIINSGYESILFADGHDRVRPWGEKHGDELHMNDIEVLSAGKADSYPLFEEGDIMVSLRNLNWIVVIDPKTELIKWSKVGPYLRQHDPDFLENGNISVFDNHRDDAQGNAFGGSRILELNPVTQEIWTLYESSPTNYFYTNALGKHQHLPNGNILITEGEAGRAFEVTPDGEVVWSYINRWDEDETAWIEEATRYPMEHAALPKEEGC